MKVTHKIIFILVLFITNLWSQSPRLVKIYADDKRPNAKIDATQRTTLDLSLPFFDNFMQVGEDKSPSALLWRNPGGVRVNNSMSMFSPDYNAAIFDGTDSSHTPYSFSNPLKRGVTDSLVSHHINLSGYQPSGTQFGDTTLCLSFFVQNGGYGEIADGREGDQFRLLFKNRSGSWDQVWYRKDTIPSINDTLIIDTYYKEFFETVYKSENFLNTYQDSIDYVKTVYPLIRNYSATDQILLDSLNYFYSIWTGNEQFVSQADSIDYYRRIYRGDLAYLENYQDFFNRVYHKSKNFYYDPVKNINDSIVYFKSIYPFELFSIPYYKYFFGQPIDDSDLGNYKELPVYHKNFLPLPKDASDSLQSLARRDSINYYRDIVRMQLQEAFRKFTRYDYYFGLSDTAFFHDKFQMAFVSQGRQSGSFDIWALDYVFLRKDAINDRGIAKIDDFTINTSMPGVLKDYNSIPLSHYTNEVRLIDTLNYTISALVRGRANNVPDRITYTVSGDLNPIAPNVLVLDEKIVLDKDAYELNIRQGVELDITPAATADSAVINSFLYIEPLGILPRTENDTLKRTTIMSDYYAYDDGSAERAFEINGRYSELAYKYRIYKEDTLTSVRIHFPKLIKSNDTKSFTLKVWKKVSDENNGRRQDTVLYSQTKVINYASADPNTSFIDFNISKDTIVIVKDSVWVGYELTTSDPIYIGYDLNPNINSANNIYYNVLGNWSQFKGNSGNLMIRPVFGKYSASGTGREGDVSSVHDYEVYPNPTDGQDVHIKGLLPVKIRVFDLIGQEYTNFSYGAETGIINLGTLKSGIYSLKIIGPEKITYKKVIIN